MDPKTMPEKNVLFIIFSSPLGEKKNIFELIVSSSRIYPRLACKDFSIDRGAFFDLQSSSIGQKFFKVSVIV